MKFYLFTKLNFYVEQQLFIDDNSSITNSNFHSDWPVRIIVHGWRDNFGSCINGYVKDAYLKKGNYNVIVVDWGDWSRNIKYNEVIPYIFVTIGPLLAKFILFLNSEGNISFDYIYIIGHNMGAHIAGIAGFNISPNIINTIFGLDPAGTGFQGNEPHRRLDKSHAKYVEQITTNMGEMGYTGLIGHAAFYPNYGRKQNHCWLFDRNSRYCNHYTAIWYFAETINSRRGFCATNCSFELNLNNQSISLGVGCRKKQCKPKVLMGGEPSIPKIGNFYLKTKNQSPFAMCNC